MYGCLYTYLTSKVRNVFAYMLMLSLALIFFIISRQLYLHICNFECMLPTYVLPSLATRRNASMIASASRALRPLVGSSTIRTLGFAASYEKESTSESFFGKQWLLQRRAYLELHSAYNYIAVLGTVLDIHRTLNL